MTETAVYVTTLEQWKSVLDVWFEQGYTWLTGGKEYYTIPFANGGRFLFLDNYIDYNISNPDSKPFIEYSEFMKEQQKEDNKMKTYYVTQEQFDLIEKLKVKMFPMSNLIDNQDNRYDLLISGINPTTELSILRYLGGDETIEFKVKEQLYRLWRIDKDGDKFYMRFEIGGTPTYTAYKDRAFTAPLEEIKKHKTISWEIERAD